MAAPLVPATAETLGTHKSGGWGQDIVVAFGGGQRSGAIDVATACTIDTDYG